MPGTKHGPFRVKGSLAATGELFTQEQKLNPSIMGVAARWFACLHHELVFTEVPRCIGAVILQYITAIASHWWRFMTYHSDTGQNKVQNVKENEVADYLPVLGIRMSCKYL